MLRTRLTLRPGQSGTRRLVDEYGPKLICVRYRYDDAQKKRYKTVELIVEEVDWIPRPHRPAPTDLVHIRVEYSEHATRRSVKLLGGVWDPSTKTWRLAYVAAVALRLTDRIVDPSALDTARLTPPPSHTHSTPSTTGDSHSITARGDGIPDEAVIYRGGGEGAK